MPQHNSFLQYIMTSVHHDLLSNDALHTIYDI